MPFFSIITVSFNAEETIAETLSSALRQDFDDFEIIVKDGLSHDNTLSKIPADNRIKVYSQKDTGIYDAMNQGTALASGEYLIYMNCGDNFASNTVLRDVYAAIRNEQPAMVYGNYIRDGFIHKQPGVITAFYLYRTPMCHQSIFFNRKKLMEIGGYDTRYWILGDYDAEVRLFFGNEKLRYLDISVCEYLGGGVSESSSGIQKKQIERKDIIKRHYPARLQKQYAVKLALTFPNLRKWIMCDTSPRFLKKMYQCIVNKMNQ